MLVNVNDWMLGSTAAGAVTTTPGFFGSVVVGVGRDAKGRVSEREREGAGGGGLVFPS